MKLVDQLLKYELVYGTNSVLKFTIPTHLRRRRQLFCKLLKERGITTYKGKWVVVVMKASPHPWRYGEMYRRIRLFPDAPIWVKEHIHQLLTPKQIDAILDADPDLKGYSIEHWVESHV